MLNIKKALTKLSNRLSFPVTKKTWSNIATPTATYYDLTTFELKPNSMYLIFGVNGNALAPEARCGITIDYTNTEDATFGCVLGSAGAGNNTVCWGYAVTGSRTGYAKLKSYGYNTNVTNMNGSAIAIRLRGG